MVEVWVRFDSNNSYEKSKHSLSLSEDENYSLRLKSWRH